MSPVHLTILQWFDIDVKYIGDDMTLTIYDEDVTSSDKVAEVIIKLSALCVNGGIDEWFQVQYKGKSAGQIHLKGVWHPDGGLTTHNAMGLGGANKYTVGVGIQP